MRNLEQREKRVNIAIQKLQQQIQDGDRGLLNILPSSRISKKKAKLFELEQSLHNITHYGYETYPTGVPAGAVISMPKGG